MTPNTNRKPEDKKLVGVDGVFEADNIEASNAHTKKHSHKRRGWISARKVNGRTYYSYSWAERDPATGEYPEHIEYLGTVEHIRHAVKEYNRNLSILAGRWAHLLKL